jgi:hypothetical protein
MAARAATCASAVLVATFAIVVGPSSATTPLKHLRAWASLGKRPPVGVTTSRLTSRPHVAHHLKPGLYRVTVIANEMLGFQLVGPGINRHTRVAVAERAHWDVTNTTWRIRLRRGYYQYRAIGPYAAGLRPAVGSFRVP